MEKRERILEIIKIVKETKSKILDFGDFKIEALPEEISQLIWLEKLNINHNHNLQNIDIIANLTNLKSLKISYTNVEDLRALEKLTSLEELDLAYTKIKKLTCLQRLKNLNWLDISNTEIKDLTPLRNLKNLSYLYASSSKISNLKPLSKLIEKGIKVILKGYNYYEGIYIEECPIDFPPLEIVQQGNKAILQYFKEAEIQSIKELYEAKLLLVGEGGVGKTSLARKIKNNEAPLPLEEETTKGIEILNYKFKTNENKTFHINIWDFGGQEIYHSTHQFFLTKRSLYILVDDTRKDDKSVNDAAFNYWLQVVALLSNKSPLLIVQNEKGDRSKEIDLKSMQARFGDMIKERYKTNLLTNRGLEEIKKAIEFYVQQLPHVGEKLPTQWAKIRKHLESLAKEKDFIDYEEYLEVCKKFKIHEEDRALFLSSYLHDLGIFLHFQDDITLQNIFILKNTWATNAVYNLLDSEEIKRKFGRFNNDDLKDIWYEDNYKRKHRELLALMMKFELCYQLPDTLVPTWLAPQLLKVEKPSFEWNYRENLVVKYAYEFMPKGILSRFIVRMHRYIKDINKAWRGGVVLERSETWAQIIETYGSNEIILYIRGTNKRELMTIATEELDRIHEIYSSQLKVNKFIPCNCSECVSSLEPHFYDFKNLSKRKEKGKLTVECEKSYSDVSVLNLLEGTFRIIGELSDSEIIEALRKNELKIALDAISKRYSEEAVILSAKFYKAEKDYHLGIIEHKDYQLIHNQINTAIISLIKQKANFNAI